MAVVPVRIKVGVSVGVGDTFSPLKYWCFKHGKRPEVFGRK